MPDARMMLFRPKFASSHRGSHTRRRHPARRRLVAVGAAVAPASSSSAKFACPVPPSLQFGEHPTTFAAAAIRIRLRSRPFPECTRKKTKERALTSARAGVASFVLVADWPLQVCRTWTFDSRPRPTPATMSASRNKKDNRRGPTQMCTFKRTPVFCPEKYL